MYRLLKLLEVSKSALYLYRKQKLFVQKKEDQESYMDSSGCGGVASQLNRIALRDSSGQGAVEGTACALQELGCSRVDGESGGGGESWGVIGMKERPVGVRMTH